jgi:hypothetical protein
MSCPKRIKTFFNLIFFPDKSYSFWLFQCPFPHFTQTILKFVLCSKSSNSTDFSQVQFNLIRSLDLFLKSSKRIFLSKLISAGHFMPNFGSFHSILDSQASLLIVKVTIQQFFGAGVICPFSKGKPISIFVSN